MIDIRKLLEAGQARQDAKHAEGEQAKLGNLRGGSAGVVGTDNKIYGECHRVALLRMLGIDKEHEANRSIMFDAGLANEDSWAAKLLEAGCSIRRETEIPVTMEIGGKKVTGRPDIVIGEWDPKPQWVPRVGCELKGVYSAGTAIRVELEGIPDPKHLAQAGFYSMALNVPYVLSYTNPAVIDVPYWAIKKLNAPKKLQPFYRHFYLRWTDDKLEYRDERNEEWVATVYTKQGVHDYFALIGELEQTKQLGPRPEGGYADGSPLPWDKCNYCPMKAACAEYDASQDYGAWIEMCKAATEKA